MTDRFLEPLWRAAGDRSASRIGLGHVLGTVLVFIKTETLVANAAFPDHHESEDWDVTPVWA
jgi:hypothetical protein